MPASGCGHDELLARLKPDFGVGIDFSGEMIRVASRKHPNLTFVQADFSIKINFKVTAQLKTPLSKIIPMTRVRLGLARLLYFVFHTILRMDKQIIRRKGVFYEVDLTEGIDLSLYLFGNFQDYVTRNRFFSIPADGVIIDVGANVGSMTFKFAGMVPEGQV